VKSRIFYLPVYSILFFCVAGIRPLWELCRTFDPKCIFIVLVCLLRVVGSRHARLKLQLISVGCILSET
jgi:hypothetical protein